MSTASASAPPTTRAKVANFVGFQIGWFACVGGAASGDPFVGPAAVALIVGLHILTAMRDEQAVALLGGALAIGVLVDGAIGAAGLIAYAGRPVLHLLPPLWILALWVLFATTFRLSMYWLTRRPALAALLGGVGGLLSYRAGQAMGALEIRSGAASQIALAIIWAIVLPLLCHLARQTAPRAST